jgi:hypothetical protein
MGVSGQRHAPAAIYSREWTLSTHWIGGWVGLRAGLDTEARGKILCLCLESNPGHAVCSQTLYWRNFSSSCEQCRKDQRVSYGDGPTHTNVTSNVHLTSRLLILNKHVTLGLQVYK